MFLKVGTGCVAVAVLLDVYRGRLQSVFRYIHAVTLVLAGVIVWAQISYARKNKIFDEFARENLKTQTLPA